MPAIKIKHVVSFNSEDKNHPADNLLKDETYRRWVCASPGEKQAFVILQFEKAMKIHSIDIGNYGSAFIEVLVGRSDANQEYQVILVASSFMTPRESRSNTNLSRVRMFETDKLNQTVADQKWDRVKIVCTQPFNKMMMERHRNRLEDEFLLQYGLSFIRFHSPPEENSRSPSKATAMKQSTLNIGPFKLKSDDENSTEDLKPGSLFARRKDKPESPTLTGAAAVRAASVAAEASLKANNNTPKLSQDSINKRRRPLDENKKPPETKKPRIQPNPKISKEAEEKRTPTVQKRDKNPPPQKQMTPAEKQPQNKNSNQKQTKPSRKKPFSKLMERIVFTISGFQNPYRGEMRDKAIEMGAKYKPDWDKSCTHLVCAFVNTPKFLQVQGKGGKIVKKDWIEECYKAKELLPWKKFRLGDGGGESSEDDTEEIEDEDEQETEPQKKESPKKHPSTPSTEKSPGKKGKSPESKPSTSTKQSMSDDDFEGSTEVESDTGSDGDTEEEIEKIRHSDTKKTNDIAMSGDEAYDADTDVEEMCIDETAVKPDTSTLNVPQLPDYFNKKHFFLYGEFDENERRIIRRYIIAFKGTIHEYMDEEVSYVITRSQWDENFDEALNDNSNLVFVKPKWIFACSDKQRLIPHQPYVVVPDTD